MRIISSVAYADELMLSLQKMASALSFVRRSCSSRSRADRAADEHRPQRSECPRPARPLEDGPFGRDQLAGIAALEQLVVGADDLDVGVAGPAPVASLTDLEAGVDPAPRRRREVTGQPPAIRPDADVAPSVVRRRDRLCRQALGAGERPCCREETASVAGVDGDAPRRPVGDDVDRGPDWGECRADVGGRRGVRVMDHAVERRTSGQEAARWPRQPRRSRIAQESPLDVSSSSGIGNAVPDAGLGHDQGSQTHRSGRRPRACGGWRPHGRGGSGPPGHMRRPTPRGAGDRD